MNRNHAPWTMLALALALACTDAAPQTPTTAVPLKIAVYGASGRTGSAIVAEALSRGHQVLGIGRDPTSIAQQHQRLSVAAGDILDTAGTADLIEGYDVVINAVRGPTDPNDPERSVAARSARSLVSALRNLGDEAPRMIMMGGGSSLEPGDGYEQWEDRPLAAAHRAALEYLRTVTDVRWTTLSPPWGGMLRNGRVRTGKYRVGGDVILRTPDGEFATISLDDFAVAMLDEIEEPRHVHRRFTVAW